MKIRTRRYGIRFLAGVAAVATALLLGGWGGMPPPAAAQVAPVPNIDLTIHLYGPDKPIPSGGRFGYEVGIHNLGEVDATNVTVQVNLPAGITVEYVGESGVACTSSVVVDPPVNRGQIAVTCTGGPILPSRHHPRNIRGFLVILRVPSLKPVACIGITPPTLLTITAVADPFNRILELNEGNNAVTSTVVVTPPKAPCPAP